MQDFIKTQIVVMDLLLKYCIGTFAFITFSFSFADAEEMNTFTGQM